MESNLLNSAADFLYDTHFYLNILSLSAIISARWLHCHKHGKCYSIVSCSPLILIGAHFLSLEINQLHDLSIFKNMMKKRPCPEINAFKNSDPVLGLRSSSIYCNTVVQGFCRNLCRYILERWGCCSRDNFMHDFCTFVIFTRPSSHFQQVNFCYFVSYPRLLISY